MKKVKCCFCGEEMDFGSTYISTEYPEAQGHKYCIMAYCNEKRKEASKPSIVRLVLGDWSDDGHGKHKEILYKSNYPIDKIQQAYKDSCKLTGVQFNHNEDYTGGLCSGYGSWRQIFTEYESSSIRPEAIEALRNHGLNPADYCEEIYTDEDFESDNSMPFYTDSAAELIMAFIALSMPKDWEYKKADIKADAINGWWGNLNVQFGYGLFY